MTDVTYIKDNNSESYGIKHSDGLTFFYSKKNQTWHRTDGPAIIRPNGDYSYYFNGLKHRDDGPAEFCTDIFGTKHFYYYKQGLLHREDGPAYVCKHHEEIMIKSYYYHGMFFLASSDKEFIKKIKLKAFL